MAVFNLKKIKSMKITSFTLGILILFSFNECLADISYARPLHIKEGTKIIEYEDKKYLLVDSAWMETYAPANADVKFDDVWLPTDRMQLSNKNEKDTLSPKHDKLEATLTYRKTVKKYYQNSVDLPVELKDSILESKDSLFLYVKSDSSLFFSIVINDISLIKDPTFVTNKDILIVPARLGIDPLSLSNIHENKNESIARIQVLPKGHIPSYIKNIVCIYNVVEVPYPVKSSGIPWVRIFAGVIIAIIISIILYIILKRKKRKEKEPLGFPQRDPVDRKDPIKEPLSPEAVIQNMRNEIERLSRDLYQEQNSTLFFRRQADKLSSDYKQLEMSVQSRIEKATSSLRDNYESVKKELKNLKDETKQKIEEARSDEKEKQKQKIVVLTDKVKTLSENLDQEKKDNKRKVEEARKEEKEKGEKIISELNTTLNTLRDNLAEKQNSLRETELALNQMTAAFERDEQTIATLNEAQRLYTEHITFVEFAHQYASNVQCLLDIVAKINESASKLIEANVPDPYLIYKAISRFSLAQSDINFENLATEVNMAASCKMTFSNNGISNLSSVAPSEQINSLRNYFLAAYLEKYINAVMVYNESLAGIDRLVKGLTPQHTAPFVQYREELKACFNRLGIVVISVKLFDTLGDNMDLKAKIIDYDDSLPAESIIEIQNCLVYPEGGRRPTDKIYVTAQR